VTLDGFAAGFLAFSFFALALFQVAIVLGAPLGEYAYGGQHIGKLPIQFRIASVFSALFALAMTGHALAQLQAAPMLLPLTLNGVVNWMVVASLGVSAVLNNITKSSKEKKLWGSTSVAMLIASAIVAI
jgi:hypothetical protein